MRSGRRARGFTLIELLVVVAIIGILAATAAANYRRSIRKAEEAALKHNLYVMRTQINNYFSDKGKYPADLQTLVEESYLRAIPQDITRSTETWVTEPAMMGEEDVSTEPGIADVHSGSDEVSLDGSSFSEW